MRVYLIKQKLYNRERFKYNINKNLSFLITERA